MKVYTTKGLLEMDALRVQDVVELGDNHRKIATEYYLNDELVRRDVVVNVLRPLLSESIQGQIT